MCVCFPARRDWIYRLLSLSLIRSCRVHQEEELAAGEGPAKPHLRLRSGPFLFLLPLCLSLAFSERDLTDRPTQAGQKIANNGRRDLSSSEKSYENKSSNLKDNQLKRHSLRDTAYAAHLARQSLFDTACAAQLV